MKFTFLLLIILVIAISQLIAQKRNMVNVKGKLIDSISHESLKYATVSILKAVDFSFIAFALSNEDGSFLVSNVPFGSNIMYITHKGYNEKQIKFYLSPVGVEYNSGTLYMNPLPANLDTVTVTTSPILINGDTTEFNASMFKTKPNSSAADLLKKLPGIEVDKNGTVTAQGQVVKQVMVNGKPFFGDDPKITISIIPTDMIAKITLINAASDQRAFSGFDNGNKEKVINIITKKDYKKGIFAKGTLGGGTDDKYAANLNFSKFNEKQQVTLIGETNNTNNQNFSSQEILSATGGNGISKTWSGGVNYNDAWSPRTSINGSYFYNKQNNTNYLADYTQIFGRDGDSSLFQNRNSLLNNRNQNNRFNFQIEHRFDSINSVLIRPTYINLQRDNFSETRTISTQGKSLFLNDVRSIVNSHSNEFNLNNNILFRHRFNKRGRTISLNFSQGFNKSEINRINNTYSISTPIHDTLNQLNYIIRDGKSYDLNFSYTEPIGIKTQLEIGYNFHYNQENSNQQSYNMNMANGKYEIIVPTLTNYFDNTNTNHRINTYYRKQISKQWNYTFGLVLQHAEIETNKITRNKYLSQTFNNFFPSIVLQYLKGSTKNLKFDYFGNVNPPNIIQLQNVIDNSNVLNIQSGNPALKQEFSHNFDLTYSNFNAVNFRNVLVFLDGSFKTNSISNAITINYRQDTVKVENFKLGPGGQFTKPVNLNGNFNFGGYVNYGLRIKNLRSNINFTTHINFQRDVNLINNTKENTDNYNIGETVRYTLNLKEQLDLNFSSKSTYIIAKFNNVSNRNINYFTQQFSVEPTYSARNGWIIETYFDYVFNKGQFLGYNQTNTLLNASIRKQIFKKKEGELRMSVFDLLKQNKNFTRSISENQVQDSHSNVLQRYFMLTFTYNVRKFSKVH